MRYEDDRLLSLDEYAVMAKAYSDGLKKQGFMFIQVDARENDELVNEIFEIFTQIASLLKYLNGFLGTDRLLKLTQKQLSAYQVMYPSCELSISYRIRGDKTRCFLHLLSLESKLLGRLLILIERSPFSNHLSSFVKERLYLCGEIYKMTGII